MENKILNFFRKKKDQKQFKTAGPGRKLNATDGASSSSASHQPKKHPDAYVPPKRNELSAEARAAAEAAMARTQKKDSRQFTAIQAQVRREMEAERKAKEELGNNQQKESSHQEEERKDLAVQSVYFRCPMISDEILPSKEWKIKIKEFLYEQLEAEKSLTACLIIHNCNTKEKAEQCIETLTKYLENIATNPDEVKYRKIRMSNRVFCEKVKAIEGGLEFLMGAGFTEQTIDADQFLIFENDDLIDTLPELLEALRNADKINIELDRNIQVLLPSQARRNELPPDFYRVSADEIRREQQLRSDAIESAQILKTKAMRERDEIRTQNMYKFSLIRVRFPDGIILQGTFNVYEKLSNIYEFIESCLDNESMEYKILSPVGYKFTETDTDKTLIELRLVPNTMLKFVYEDHVTNPIGNYLKKDILMLIQEL